MKNDKQFRCVAGRIHSYRIPLWKYVDNFKLKILNSRQGTITSKYTFDRAGYIFEMK